MAKKTVTSLLLVLLFAAALTSSVGILHVEAQSKTWIVDDNGPADFSRIQDAINAANVGDTVFVHSGTYHEHIDINKALTLLGENKSNTVIDADALNTTVIRVMANNVLISRFTIQRGQTGVYVQKNSNGVTISNNDILQNEHEGISIYESEDETISNNILATNGWDGIFVFDTRNATLYRNVLRSNGLSGGYFENSSLISAVGNSVLNQSTGIYMDNVLNGAFYHNNFINNTSQVLIDASSNAWDNGVEGNFWSDYSGPDLFSGSSQNVAGSDGLGDIPYTIDLDNIDNYPLMGVITFFDSGVPSSGMNFVHVVSNSTVSDFHLDSTERKMSFNVTAGTSLRFCRVSIPKAVADALWSQGYKVSIDGGDLLSFSEWPDSTYNHSYFTFNELAHEVAFEASDVRPPNITIISPENKAYSSRDIPLILTLSEQTSWMGYSLDSQANVTLNGNATIASLSEGAHEITLFANDTTGNMGRSDIVHFTVDTTAPAIVVVSPQNTTYTSSSVPLAIQISESTSWIGYSLDGQANTTASSQSTTTLELSSGIHSLIVYAKDVAGNTGSSQKIDFTVNAQSSQGLPMDLLLILTVAAIIAIVVVASLLVYFGRIRKRASKTK